MFKEREDYNSPEYKSWRNSVFVRDQWKCIKCVSKENIQAHHIKKYSDYPSLRFLQSNGVTLCKRCHDQVTGKEEAYEKLFIEYVQSTKKGYTKRREKTRKWKKRNCDLRY